MSTRNTYARAITTLVMSNIKRYPQRVHTLRVSTMSPGSMVALKDRKVLRLVVAQVDKLLLANEKSTGYSYWKINEKAGIYDLMVVM
jgi:hypothetical protein